MRIERQNMTDNLRIIESARITKAVAELCITANKHLCPDVRRSLSCALQAETSELAQSALSTILKNAEIAERENLPICQDTGMTVVFVTIGSNVHINGDVESAINEGVRQGYRDGYCRNSIVRDPINRVNTGDNTPAVIHYNFASGDELRITVAPKGFGSENMGRVRMLNPSDGLSGVEDFVVETVKEAGANPCPPIIVGVGVGGTMDKAALMAKEVLLREAGSVHNDPVWSSVELRLLERINALNIGAAGFGGKTTALGVFVQTFPTHIAGLPVAVNISCHATRRATVIL